MIDLSIISFPIRVTSGDVPVHSRLLACLGTVITLFGTSLAPKRRINFGVFYLFFAAHPATPDFTCCCSTLTDVCYTYLNIALCLYVA